MPWWGYVIQICVFMVSATVIIVVRLMTKSMEKMSSEDVGPRVRPTNLSRYGRRSPYLSSHLRDSNESETPTPRRRSD